MTTILTPYHLDEQLSHLAIPGGAATVITADLPEGSTWGRLAVLYDRVAEAFPLPSAPVSGRSAPPAPGTRGRAPRISPFP